MNNGLSSFYSDPLQSSQCLEHALHHSFTLNYRNCVRIEATFIFHHPWFRSQGPRLPSICEIEIYRSSRRIPFIASSHPYATMVDTVQQGIEYVNQISVSPLLPDEGVFVALLNLHRAFFAQALQDNLPNLSNHRYIASVTAIYRSAWRLSHALRVAWDAVPEILSRFSLAWSQGLSAAVR